MHSICWLLEDNRSNVIIRQNNNWTNLDAVKKQAVRDGMNITWSPTDIDTSYTHLQRTAAQGYASKGYELKKENFK